MSMPLSRKLVDMGSGMLLFWCPGCEEQHAVWVDSPNSHGAKWGWNGDAVRPTFTPSILRRGVKMTAKGRADYEVWLAAGCPAGAGEFEKAPSVCHSFITDGRIQFLSDCTHAMAGQDAILPDLPDWLIE